MTGVGDGVTSGPCITVASYNMRKAIGLDRRRDPHRVLDVLQEIDADIVALQEADQRFGGRGSAVPHELIDSHGLYKPVISACATSACSTRRGEHADRLLKVNTPQHRLARQCHTGEAAYRRDRLRRARPADAGAARRGHGRAADRRPAAARRRHAPRSVGAVAAGGRCARSSTRSPAAAENADGADGRHQRMADRPPAASTTSSPNSTSPRPARAFMPAIRSPASTGSSSTRT